MAGMVSPSPMPLARIWQDTVAFVRAERALLVPVAGAMVLLPEIGSSLSAQSATGAFGSASPWGAPLRLWSMIGMMAVTALVLRPGASVGEAISRAARRLWPLALILLAVMLLGGMAGIALQKAGYDFTNPRTLDQLTSGQYWLLMGLLLGFTLVMVRLITLIPVIIDRNDGPVAAVRQSWGTTRGRGLALFGAALLFGVLQMIFVAVVPRALGTVLLTLGAGQGTVGFIAALLSALIATVFGVYLSVFIARFYLSTKAPA